MVGLRGVGELLREGYLSLPGGVGSRGGDMTVRVGLSEGGGRVTTSSCGRRAAIVGAADSFGVKGGMSAGGVRKGCVMGERGRALVGVVRLHGSRHSVVLALGMSLCSHCELGDDRLGCCEGWAGALSSVPDYPRDSLAEGAGR